MVVPSGFLLKHPASRIWISWVMAASHFEPAKVAVPAARSCEKVESGLYTSVAVRA